MRRPDLVIIGAGPAGMAAAEAAYEAGIRDILLIERDQFPGGILNQCVHTGFGVEFFKEVLTGPEYAHRFAERLAARPEIEISLSSLAVSLTRDSIVRYMRPGGFRQVRARAVIVASGCRERTREMIHIPGTRPAGVYSAGLAQKMINIEGWLPGKRVVIVGSGDIGLIMARRFVLEGAEVAALIEVRKEPSGLVRNFVQCVDDFGIPVYFKHKVSGIHGKNRVEKVSVVKVDDAGQEIAQSSFEIPCDTVLVSVGLIPENELLEAAGGSIDAESNCPVFQEPHATSIPGIFACGNCAKVYDLVDWVTRDSLACGYAAARYIQGAR